MTTLADPNTVRKFLRISAGDVTDEELDFYIEQANTIVFEDVAIQVIGEELSGKINGTNTTFSTQHKYIADTDFDCVNSIADVTVYAWGKEGSLSTRKEWGVSSINAEYGLIFLSSAPVSTYDVLTIDYYYYRNKPNWYLLKRAANIWAAYEFILSEYLLIPKKLRRGALSFEHTKPYEELYLRYQRAINMFNKKLATKKKYKHIKMGEDYLNEY
jgi:hypothetical protein